MKIKCKELTPGCKFKINPKGDWIDLIAADTYAFNRPNAFPNGQIVYDYQMIGFGIAMQLPKGFEAIMKGRSSLTRKMKLELCCSGVMDNSYRGEQDEWKAYVKAIDSTVILKGDRVCQFRIQLNQFATPWQKIKWLLGCRPEFVWVDHFEGTENRGGFGSTGR